MKRRVYESVNDKSLAILDYISKVDEKTIRAQMSKLPLQDKKT